MLITIDPGSDVPLFEQLASSIRAAVMGGTIGPRERLPAARDLAASLDVNVHTVLRGYQLLRDEGFVELRRGRGAIVTAHGRNFAQLDRDISRVVAEARGQGLTLAALIARIREEYTS